MAEQASRTTVKRRGPRVAIHGLWRLCGRRRLMAAAVDVVLIFLAYYLILVFRLQGSVPESMGLGSQPFLIFLAAAVVLHLGFNTLFHVYSIVNRYVGLPQATWVVKATVASVVLLLVLDLAWWTGGSRLVPLSVVIVGGAAAGTAMLAVRFYSRLFQTRSLRRVRRGKSVVLVGAGAAAELLLRQIDNSPALDLRVVGLLDDDPALQGMRMLQYPVLGTVADAARVAEEHDLEEFIITIPSASAQQMERIYAELKKSGLPVKTLPAMSDLIGGEISMADVRELKIDDILGRSPVQTDLESIAGYLKDRRVLVTGAAGSIGSELCRQIASFGPRNLILVDRDESGLYALHEELRTSGFSRYEMVTTHIQHAEKMRLIMEEHRPHVVFHAAAFKHVPLMEVCPDEAVFNNVMGTLSVTRAAAAFGVERFVNISTDKAADPISVMGASKRVAELIVQQAGIQHPAAHFSSVRFGNVLGSRGSMLPIFQKQIENGGPVTVTHKDMTRYFMSIAEAVQLVLQAASMSVEAEPAGGVFILEMGEPVSILEIAKKMIIFVGNGRAADISIEFTGLRPGERLHETLVGRCESAGPTTHPMIAYVPPGMASGDEVYAGGSSEDGGEPGAIDGDLTARLERLFEAARRCPDRDTLVHAFRSIVPTYRPFELTDAGVFPGCEGGMSDEAERPRGPQEKKTFTCVKSLYPLISRGAALEDDGLRQPSVY